MSLAKNGKKDPLILAQVVRDEKWEKLLGRSVRVRHHLVPIILCSSIKFDGGECAGCYSAIERAIYIDITSDCAWETFMHEFIHAEISEGGLRQHPDWCEKLEEIVCETLAVGLLANFRFRRLK